MTSLPKTLFTKYMQSLRSLQAEPEHAFDFDRCLREQPALKTILENSPFLSFILDYRTGKYHHISANVQQVVGKHQEAFYSEGVALTLDIYDREDQKIYLNAIFENRLKFMQSLKSEMYARYSYQHNFRVVNKRSRPVHLLQEYRVLKSDTKGNPFVILGFCTDISYIKADTRITNAIILHNPGELPTPVEISYYYPRPEEGLLTVKELEILKWILEGLSSKETADRMNISMHTVRTHRKHMHEKTNAKNIADLLRYALVNGLV